MRRLVLIGMLAVLTAAVIAGCGKVEDRAVLTITDNEGKVEQRSVTVGYVNERLDRIPPTILSTTPGDEGKREFLDEIVRKELIVVAGLRAGLDKSPNLDQAEEYFAKSKAEEMLFAELVDRPSEPTQAELEEHNRLRETQFQLQEIVVMGQDAADEAYRRVTEGGEDFATVAREVSVAGSAAGGGEQRPMQYTDLHPLIAQAVGGLQTSEVAKPIDAGGPWYVVKVMSRKEASEPKALEGQHLAGVKMEATNFKRGLKQYEVFTNWMKAANPTYNEDAVALAAKKIGEKVAEAMPQFDLAGTSGKQETFDRRMQLASMQVVPDLSEDEAKLELARYKIGDEERVWTLGDLRTILSATPGMEGVKSDDPAMVKRFMDGKVQEQIVQHEVETRGYRNSRELKDHVAQRMEEALVELTYNTEVVQKTPDPTGEEVKEYFFSHRSDYMEPVKVTVQQIIVGTEAQANALKQTLSTGQATFTDLVRKQSIDDWSKSKDGIIEDYHQGERRLDYLQGVAFSLKVNEVSEPVRAPGGYALVKLLKTTPERELTFDEVGNTVKESLVSMAREKRLTEFLDQVRATVTVEVVEKNLKHMKDPSEIRAEKLGEKAQTPSGEAAP